MSVVHKQLIANAEGIKISAPLNAAVKAAGTLYVSGQLGIDTSTGLLVQGGIQAQTKYALQHMDSVLKQAGCTKHNVVKCIALLADYDDFAEFNKEYAKYFTDKQPARMCYQVAKLPLNARVEIDATAVCGDVVHVPSPNL